MTSDLQLRAKAILRKINCGLRRFVIPIRSTEPSGRAEGRSLVLDQQTTAVQQSITYEFELTQRLRKAPEQLE